MRLRQERRRQRGTRFCGREKERVSIADICTRGVHGVCTILPRDDYFYFYFYYYYFYTIGADLDVAVAGGGVEIEIW